MERLAFPLQPDEADLPGIYARPLSQVVRVLTSCATVAEAEVYENLPDTTEYPRC